MAGSTVTTTPGGLARLGAQPWLRWSWQTTDRHRLVTTVAMLGMTAAVAMAVFGLPPVDLHGPLHRFGIMDPLCGGTRAARYTTQGELGLAWRYNPLGIVTVAMAAVVTARTGIGLVGRRWLTLHMAWTPRRLRIVIGVGLVLLIMLEVRQQLRVDLLMAGT